MFDKVHLHHHEGPTHSTVNVTENRAPTDESVRLLKEMEAAAQAKISESIRVENSPIDCVIYRAEDMMNDQVKYAFRMKINGRDLDAKVAVGPHLSRDDAMLKMMQAVSERIAAEILSKSFAQALGKFSQFP